MANYNGITYSSNWIKVAIDKDMVQWADGLGEELAPKKTDDRDHKPMTTTQLRRFFGEVKRIENDFPKNQTDVYMLEPMLAYAVGRSTEKENRIKVFYQEIKPILNDVCNQLTLEKFKRFVKIFEAIVAYHKFHGGK